MAFRMETSYPDCKPAGPMTERVVSAIARNRVRLSLVVFFLLIVDDVLAGVHPHHLRFCTDIWALLGLCLVILGLGVRSWAAGVISKGNELACVGPYSLTRHPLYAGSLLMTVGFCTLVADGRNVWIVLAATAFVYGARLHREERTLHAKFGREWRCYASRTALLFPRRLPVEIGSDWSLQQWRRNREYRALLATLVGLFALKLWGK